ncbi:Lytic transglycosylase catalytic [Alkalidesulfovibrio alkalitolerans DSM 16529]|jgi:membrane-bound lytic murein transglycosylase D|uniref:Lytic transglycosylase catalytic n=1 Tax=Alkalidesulfovibrio alkalitolerans DSM 16529 TaxID=1121439 RepID=S7TD64_9BACT|nr:LysM peptidoglycan-binding domain-containing protein [Alkalidesulfovibrio alkalitolerans]EPR34500.1 Lytic transglycosylase catalytic [Alkalidesulfovibrio alkalitolerans DSM 16529]
MIFPEHTRSFRNSAKVCVRRGSLRILMVIAALLFVTACATHTVGPDAPPAQVAKASKAKPTQADARDGVDFSAEEAAEASDDALTPEQQKVLSADDGITLTLSQRENQDFVNFFKFFTATDENGKSRRGRVSFERWLERAKIYLPYVRQVVRERGLPDDVIFLPFAESGYNPWAVSRAGAVGMWQFMPFTGRKYGLTVDWWIDQRRDPYMATHAAMDYLSVLYGMFGDWHLALAAYNAGEGRVGRAIRNSGSDDFFEICRLGSHLPRETRQYVPKIMAINKIILHLEELGFEPIDWNHDPDIASLNVPGGTDLLALSKAVGLDWSEFEALNPAFRRTVSPPEMETPIYLPSEKVAHANAYLAKPEARPFAGYATYTVRSGDSWWAISRRHQVPINILRTLNRGLSSTLHPGQTVMIPAQGANANIAAAPSGSRAAQAESAVANAESRTAATRALAAKRSNYIVKSGDSLWSISKRHGVSLNSLLAANGLSNGNRIKAGQRLYIPGAGEAQTREQQARAKETLSEITYRVQQGDTIWGIARKYNVNPSHLLAWNSLNRNSVLRPGQEIRIRLP